MTRRIIAAVALTFVLVLNSTDVKAQFAPEPDVSANDFGGVGLLQTRTARMAPVGSLELGALAVEPYRGLYLLTQPLSWLELSFRAVDITNVSRDGTVRPLEEVSFMEDLLRFRGGGTVTDRNFDIKIRLSEETRVLPAFAIGAQDILGRARFGGEYIVASKRIGALDFSFGLGWGYLGSRNHVGNPFSLFRNSFKSRSKDEGRGTLNLGSYFAGKNLAVFGGVEWETPLDGVSLKVEYNGADPALEPYGNPLEDPWPVNVGLAYRPLPWLDMAVGFERGNSVMLRTAIRFDMFDLPYAFRDKPRPSREGFDPLPHHEPINRQVSSSVEDPAGLDMRLAALLDRLGLEDAHVNYDALSLSLVVPQGVRLTPLREHTIVDALFGVMMPSMATVWLSQEGERAGAARYYRRKTRAGEESSALLALIDDEGEQGASSVILSNGTAQLVASDEAVLISDDDLLRHLPDDILRVAVAATDWDDEEYEHGISMKRASAEARHILAALPDDVTVSSLDIDGGAQAVLTVKGIDSGNVDGGRLAEHAELGHVLVVPTGYDTADLFSEDSKRLFAILADAGINARAMAWNEGRLTVWVDTPFEDKEVTLIGRTARLLAQETPQMVEAIAIRRGVAKIDVVETRLLRRDILKALQGKGSPEELWLTTVIDTEPHKGTGLHQKVKNPDAYPVFSWGAAPFVRQHAGDRESGLWLADLSVDLLASLTFMPGLELSAVARQYVVGNLDHIVPQGNPDALPVVRRDIRRYIKEGRTSIPRLQADYRFALSEEFFGRLSVGIFEEMYAGLSGEVLFAPAQGKWAYGAELNWVKRRGVEQLLGLVGGDRVTGDVSLYREWSGGFRTVFRAGRYLGGDWGGTIDLSRRFDNGVRIGGYLTLTDKTRKEFAALNPANGVYITIPLSSFWPFGGPRSDFSTGFEDISRDSGQRLRLNGRLYEQLNVRNKPWLTRDWGDIFN